MSGAASSGELIKESSTAEFMADVVEASKQQTVIVDFWAPWCQPCKQLTPVLEKIVKSYGGKLRLVKINVDENQAIAGQLRVQSLPTVLAFQDGKPIDGFMGAQPESTIKEFADRVVGADEQDQIAAVVQTAEEALAEGDLQGAAEAFAAVLQVDQENVDALAGLASCYLKSGDAKRAEQTIELVPPAKRTSAKVESVKAALELAKMAEATGPVDELAQKLLTNPMTFKRGSISRCLWSLKVTSLTPLISCLRLSNVIESGTIKLGADSWSNCLKHGVRKIRLQTMGAAVCRQSYSLKGCAVFRGPKVAL